MVTRLEAQHARNRQSIENEAQRLLRRAWTAGDVDSFVEQAIVIDELARSATVAETDAYLTAALLTAGIDTTPAGLDPEAFRRPVDPQELWSRPAKHVRMKLADGVEPPAATSFGRHMAGALLATGLQYAARGASAFRLGAEPSATGYRRVTGSKPCGLCVAASDQLYHVEQLMPIHDNCHCTVKPVSLERRYGLSDGEYQRVLEQTGGDTSRASLSKVRLHDLDAAVELPAFRVVEHGELGPYLFDANHKAPLLDAAA